MNALAYSTYKDFLRAYVDQDEQRGAISRLAAICGCNRTYISQVLNGKAELTGDHMVQLLDSIGLKALEADYLMLLLLRDKSGSRKARELLNEKIRRLKSDALTVSHKVYSREKPKEISEEQRTLYYSSWIYGATHILTSIKEYQTPGPIAEKLNVPKLQVLQILKDLVDMGVVRQEKGNFVHSGGDVYLPRHYAQSASQHLNWRMKAVERSTKKDDIHYTLAFSVSLEDVEKLRHQVIQMIEEQRKVVRASGAEAACVFCVDFFSL